MRDAAPLRAYRPRVDRPRDMKLSREEVLSHCGEHLGAFKVPKLVEFRDEIPKSPLGKVLRKYLL